MPNDNNQRDNTSELATKLLQSWQASYDEMLRDPRMFEFSLMQYQKVQEMLQQILKGVDLTTDQEKDGETANNARKENIKSNDDQGSANLRPIIHEQLYLKLAELAERTTRLEAQVARLEEYLSVDRKNRK
jgi:hypothetical protein